jgi:predicted PurR-regulated permease PerM
MASDSPLVGGSRFLLVVASLVVVIAGLRAASQIILPFLVAAFIAILSLPLLFWLERRGCKLWLAVSLTIMADVLVMAAVVVLVGGSINELTEELPKYERKLRQITVASRDWLAARGVPTQEWSSVELLDPSRMIALTQSTLRGVAAVLSNALVVVLITIFILFEAATFPVKLRQALGDRGFEERFGKVTHELQRYLGFKTLISAATGIVVGAWVAILGVDFALLWGLTAFLLNFIPNLGSILAAIPAVLLAVVQFGVGRALLVGIGYLVVNVVLGNFVEPSLMGRKLGLSTLVVFLSLVFWGWVWGPVGMLLSVPLTVIVKIMLENTQEFRWVAVLLGPAKQMS